MAKSGRKFWTEGPGSFVVAVAIALFIRWALMEAYVIPSGSMLPTLLVHDHIFVNKVVYGVRLPFTEHWLSYFYEPERGDVVVFKYPENKDLFYIKRVIGLPGDRVFYDKGNLYINDELIERTIPTTHQGDLAWLKDSDFPGEEAQGGVANYVHWQEQIGEKTYSILTHKGEPSAPTFGPYTVPEGHLFVMGDNRDNSQDSRAWDAKAIKARGSVVIRRAEPGAPLTLPEGLVVKTAAPGVLAVRFRTDHEAQLIGSEVRVPITAVDPGANGNVGPGQVVQFEDLQYQGLQVTNTEALSEGVDKRFVPRDYLVGRAMFVWLSCESTLPVAKFLCNPLTIRWSRFFQSVE